MLIIKKANDEKEEGLGIKRQDTIGAIKFKLSIQYPTNNGGKEQKESNMKQK